MLDKCKMKKRYSASVEERGARMREMIKRLLDAELKIMMIIWEAKGSVTSAYIMEKLKGEETWGQTTVLNFLSRLVDRGFLKHEKEGKSNLYTPIIEEEVYLESESKSFLERLHGNSIRSLISALYKGHALKKEDLEELQAFIEEKTKGE